VIFQILSIAAQTGWIGTSCGTSLGGVPMALSIATLARRIQWRTVLFIAKMAYDRGSAAYQALHPHERTELRELAAKSKGRPGNLSAHERGRIRELAAKALRGARGG
jgi:hypothetical protein